MSLVLRRAILTFVTAASVAGIGLIYTQASASQAPIVSTAASGGTTAELQQLLAQKYLIGLHTTYNGDYGTSLLLVNKDTTAYVALSYHEELWRVYKSMPVAPAEDACETLAGQTQTWAEDDLCRAITAGQKTQPEREAQTAQQHVASLSQEMRIMQAQRQKMLTEQQTMHQETKALDIERRMYQTQVGSLQQQIRLLEKQLNDPHWSPAP